MPRRNQTPKHTPFFDTSNCKNKRRFTSKEQAEEAIITQELQNAPLSLSAYKCDRCGGWHLTRGVAFRKNVR